MAPFTTLTSPATPFFRENVDTDVIIPAEHLKTTAREGLGRFAFASLRYGADGEILPENIFDRAPFNRSGILIAGKNFGCGSSREHAVWALMDMGYACVIAPSFAEIFASNALNNGMLLVALDEAIVAELAAEALEGASMTIDLPAQTITTFHGERIPFDIDLYAKARLLEGLDAVGATLKNEAAIAAFEERDRKERHWLYVPGE
ncbi:MAG: 3-isopropylmalate dehydratase small subunit [Parvularculaceae bacterium]